MWSMTPRQTKANLDKFAGHVQATLPKDSAVNLATQGCMPLTVLVKVNIVLFIDESQTLLREQSKGATI